MKSFLRSFYVAILITTFVNSIFCQPIETLYPWFINNHSAWKVQPNSPTGYVMIGNKFFGPNNTSLYVQGFDESGTSLWLKPYSSGMALQTFWKSFTVVNTNPVKFFAVTANVSGNKTFALLVDANGNKIWDRISDLPASGYQLGGVSNANGNNSGWLACGSDNNGNVAVTKFDNNGFSQWTKSLPLSGFAWSIIPATGGGYYIGSTGNKVTKIDNAGDLVWTSSFSLPPSPAPDGSNYTYTEFEEVVELPNGDGVLISGSAFSNSFSAVYTARVSTTGTLIWKNLYAPQNTSLGGTPVSWINNVIIDVTNSAVTSWRTGPVSSGGQLWYQRQYINSGVLTNGEISLGNTIPVQEAFMIKAHNKYVIGGTRGGYTAAYSYINGVLPIPGRPRSNSAEYSLPVAQTNVLTRRIQINRHNSKPEFEYPATSRVFNSKMRVFPNPSNGLVNVGGKIEPGATLRVTDLMGRLILERPVMPGDDLIKLDLTQQGKGIYNIEMVSRNQLVTKKIVLQ
ncbi:MAG: T9SS type A sorting domain-containing protein [Saprospiraceae bacterium]